MTILPYAGTPFTTPGGSEVHPTCPWTPLGMKCFWGLLYKSACFSSMTFERVRSAVETLSCCMSLSPAWVVFILAFSIQDPWDWLVGVSCTGCLWSEKPLPFALTLEKILSRISNSLWYSKPEITCSQFLCQSCCQSCTKSKGAELPSTWHRSSTHFPGT